MFGLKLALYAVFISTIGALSLTNSARELEDVSLSARQTKVITYIGCVADGGPRVLRHSEPSNAAATSYAFCTDACFAAGYALAGVEFGHECWCGNAILYNYGSGTCNTPCPGNSANTCGGSGALQLYSTGAGPYTTGPASFLLSYSGWKITECWKDEVAKLFGGPHTLPNHPSPNPSSATMTVEKCIDACAASGYTSAGLEWGQECWCGNKEYPIGESTVYQECQKPCNGNAGEYCGDSGRILVYTSLPWNLPFP